MSYEYKDTIQDSVIDYYDHVLLCNEYTDKILDELDKVYSQAAKADEYKAKAKAFDESLEAIRVNLKSVRSDYGGFTLNALKKQRVVTTENVLEAIEILMAGLLEYHESGEPNA